MLARLNPVFNNFTAVKLIGNSIMRLSFPFKATPMIGTVRAINHSIFIKFDLNRTAVGLHPHQNLKISQMESILCYSYTGQKNDPKCEELHLHSTLF
jgi:hypothetical protein